MAAHPAPTTNHHIKRDIITILATILAVALLVWGVLFWFTHNYAQDAAKPLESALNAAGATKQCSSGDAGRGPDSTTPKYQVIYSIPEDSVAATAIVKKAAAQSGFSLRDDTPPPNPEDNKFYIDDTSKTSKHFDLKGGNIKLLVEIYGSKTFAGDKRNCFVKQKTNDDKTTLVDIAINLPEFK